jgi:hypothetical protein
MPLRSGPPLSALRLLKRPTFVVVVVGGGCDERSGGGLALADQTDLTVRGG